MYYKDTHGNFYGVDAFGEEIQYLYDLNGNPVKRTPSSHPYNYDEYVVWKDETFNPENYSAVYSDRLYQWDPNKFNKCCKEVGQMGQYFHDTDRTNIQKFLCLYFEKEIKLTAIVQGCNQSSGFPYWVFCYEEIV